MKKLLTAVIAAAGIAGLSFAETPKKVQALKTGQYTAQLKPFVCSGCPEFIQKALIENKGIGSAKVVQSTVYFTVKEGSTVKTEDLQKTLKSYAGKMGMGADYSLSDIKPVKKAG